MPLALASAMLFGATAPFSKLLLGAIEPQLLAGLLYLGAGVGLAGVHLARHVFHFPVAESPLRRADMRWLAAVVLFRDVIGPLLLMFGLTVADAASSSLLLNIEGLATMGIAWLVFRENVDRQLVLGAFVGVSLVLFILALRHLGTARTGAYFSLAPFIGAAIAIGLLHDPLTLKLTLVAILIGFGLWLHLKENHVHGHRHSALEHAQPCA